LIVVDTNIIAYLYLPTIFTKDVEMLQKIQPDWAAPVLWKSEFRNILALHLRKELIELDTAFNMMTEAEELIGANEYLIDSTSVITLTQSGCSAYDCEFISLAKSLDTKLVTADKKLLRIFPEVSITAKEYILTTP
jgi:predicted nucleic acid-binding protein